MFRSFTRRTASPRVRIVGPGLAPLKLKSGVNRLPGETARGTCRFPTICSVSGCPGHSSGRHTHGSDQSSTRIVAGFATRIRRRRLRRALSLSRSWRLRGRARGRCVNRTHRREPRCPNLQQFAPRQQARLARLVVLIHLCMSPGSWLDCNRKPTKLGRRISAVRLQSMLRRVMLIAFTFPRLVVAAVPARAFVGQVIDAQTTRTDRERRSHCRRPPRIRADRTGRQIRVATESGAASRLRRHPPGRGRLPPDSLRDAR